METDRQTDKVTDITDYPTPVAATGMGNKDINTTIMQNNKQ